MQSLEDAAIVTWKGDRDIQFPHETIANENQLRDIFLCKLTSVIFPRSQIILDAAVIFGKG